MGTNISTENSDAMKGQREEKAERGFTLLELMMVIMVLAILTTFAAANWMPAGKGKQTLVEQLSVTTLLLREAAMTNYETKVIEFDLTEKEISTGRMDARSLFVREEKIILPEKVRLRNVVLNGRLFSQDKVLMAFFPSGIVDRAVVHLEGEKGDYTILVNAMTGKVEGKEGYVEEIKVQEGINAP